MSAFDCTLKQHLVPYRITVINYSGRASEHAGIVNLASTFVELSRQHVSKIDIPKQNVLSPEFATKFRKKSTNDSNLEVMEFEH